MRIANLLKLNTISGKMIAGSVLVFCLAIGLAVGLSLLQLWRQEHLSTQQQNEMRLQQVHVSLALAADEVASGVTGVELNRAAAGDIDSIKANQGSFSISQVGNPALLQLIDRISATIKGPATIFVFDPTKDDFVRIATSIKKPDQTRAVGTVLGKGGEVSVKIRNKETYRGVATILGEDYFTGYMPILSPNGEVSGILFVGLGKIAEMNAATNSFTQTILLSSLGILALIMLIIVPVVKKMTKPFATLSEITKKLDNWDKDAPIPFQSRSDEVGVLAKALQVLKNGLATADDLRAGQEQEQAKKLSRQSQTDAEIMLFRSEVGELLDRAKEDIREMQSMAQNLDLVMRQTESETSSAKGAIVAAMSKVEALAQSSDELAQACGEIAVQADASSRIVAEALQKGEDSARSVSRLSENTERIGQVVTLIQEIASRTNLLALNATIEAARAGEAGRGFSVVASEVKQLASQTTSATEEISEQITNIQNSTLDAVAAVRAVGNVLSGINASINTIASAVEEQGVGTQKISENASQASANTEEARQNFAAIGLAVESSKSVSEQVRNLGSNFSSNTENLLQSINAFLEKVAA
jgi:methyl-accepting chemotaxis protein